MVCGDCPNYTSGTCPYGVCDPFDGCCDAFERAVDDDDDFIDRTGYDDDDDFIDRTGYADR